MLNSSEFDSSLPVGALVAGRPSAQLAPPVWMQWDGGVKLRADYPELEDSYPVGKLTGTARTLAAVSANSPLAASPTYFVAGTGASNSAAPIQYSTDGVTWSTASVVTGNNVAACVIWAGTRWVLAMAVATIQPHVTTGDNPNSTWAATTGGTTSLGSTAQNCMAYSPTLNRVVLLPFAAGTSVFTLDGPSGTAWTTRSGLASLTRKAVAWTGNVFIVVVSNSATVSASADGITWTESTIPEPLGASLGYIASDGAGTAVITGSANALLVTKDHGASWQRAIIPGVATSDAWRVTFSGGRFWISTAAGLASSVNGTDWFLDLSLVHAFSAAAGIAKKGTVAVQVLNSTTAYSFTESATEFYAPNVPVLVPAASGAPIPVGAYFQKAL